jgi:hypothetical protein
MPNCNRCRQSRIAATRLYRPFTTRSRRNTPPLNQLLEAGNASAAQVGQLMLDIQALQKQTTSSDGPYKTQSLNVLTADQKAKLPKLTEALQLQPAVGEAGMLLLIDYPQYRILPATSTSNVGSGAANLLGAVSR